MNDVELDRLLTDAGTAFRADHTRAASPLVRPKRRAWVLPLGAAAATAAVVAVAALLLPLGSGSRPRPAPVAGTLTLDVGDVSDASLGEDYLALSVSPDAALSATLEVRRRSDLASVVLRARTHFAKGSLGCPHVEGPWVAWVDNEDVETTLVPGPETRWSLELENVVTHEHRTLASGGPGSAGPSRSPCAVGNDGRIAWNPVVDGGRRTDPTSVSVLDLATGQVTTTTVPGQVLALTPDGQPVLEQHSGTRMRILVGDRLVTTVENGTMASSDGRTIITFADDPATDNADGAFVRVCSLPACTDSRQIANEDGAAQGVVGSTFVAWSALSDSPSVRLLSGGTPAPVAPGYVPFRTMAAYDDAFLYVTRPDYATLGEEAVVILHVQRPATRS